MPKISKALTTTEALNSYSPEGDARKRAFHKEGKKFLAKIAADLGLTKADYDLRSNVAGIAVSGEVTLHTDTFYLQLSESFMKPGVGMLHRSCKDRKDYTGGQNNMVQLKDLEDDSRYERLLQMCRAWMAVTA
jgi:hypothetical protein